MKEIQMTDQIGDLSQEQLASLSTGLEHAFEMTLRPTPGGAFHWLERLDGGALLIKPSRTVAEVWSQDEAINAEAEKQNTKLSGA